MVHTHARTRARRHTDKTGHELAWESLSVRLPLVALLLDAVLRLTRSWPGDRATEYDGTGQWESNGDAGGPGAGPSDGTDTPPPLNRPRSNNFSAAGSF